MLIFQKEIIAKATMETFLEMIIRILTRAPLGYLAEGAPLGGGVDFAPPPA